MDMTSRCQIGESEILMRVRPKVFLNYNTGDNGNTVGGVETKSYSESIGSQNCEIQSYRTLGNS